MEKSIIAGKRFRKTIFLLTFFLLSSVVTAHGAQWAKTYGGIGAHWPGHQWANSIQQTSDGGYIVAGASNSFGGLGFNFGWVLKLDANGVRSVGEAVRLWRRRRDQLHPPDL